MPTKVRRPYSRVYWEALDDAKFADVWDDDHALATWLRLLLGADMAWPASASLYHGVHRKALQKLTDVGLVDVAPGGRYRIHGLDNERAARSRSASEAANTRWDDDMPPHPVSNAKGIRPHPVSNAKGVPSRDSSQAEHSQAEHSQAEHEKARATTNEIEEPYATLERLTDFPIQRVEPSAIRGLDALVDRRGVDVVVAALGAIAPSIDPQPPAPWPLVAAVRNRLEPIASTPRMTPREAEQAQVDAIVAKFEGKR